MKTNNVLDNFDWLFFIPNHDVNTKLAKSYVYRMADCSAYKIVDERPCDNDEWYVFRLRGMEIELFTICSTLAKVIENAKVVRNYKSEY